MKKIIIIEDTDDLFAVADKINLVINLNNMSISVENQKDKLDGIKHPTEEYRLDDRIKLKTVISEALKNCRIKKVRFIQTMAAPLSGVD